MIQYQVREATDGGAGVGMKARDKKMLGVPSSQTQLCESSAASPGLLLSV